MNKIGGNEKLSKELKLFQPWEEYRKQIKEILGDESILKAQWDLLEQLVFIWIWNLIL